MAHLRKLVPALTLALVWVGAASAEGPPLKGAGAQFCSTALRHGGGIDPAAVQWVMGYLNGRLSAPGPVPPHKAFGGPDRIRATLITYCRTHPHWQVADGASTYF